VCAAYEEAVPVFTIPLKSGESRIIGGEEAAKGQFPYQAAITLSDYDFCGGSLISKNWVLTAGHCVDRYSQWTVDLGALPPRLQRTWTPINQFKERNSARGVRLLRTEK